MEAEVITLCACFRDKPRFEFAEETYDDETVFAVLSGSFDYALGDGGAWRRAAAGQAVFCPRGVAFRRRMVSPASFALLHFRTKEPLPHGAEPVKPGNTRRFFEDIERLMQAPLCFSPEEVPEVAHFARDLLFLCRETQRSLPPVIAEAYARLTRDPSPDLSIHALAREAGYTEAQFIRLFRRCFGCTPKQCLIDLRMDKAKLLLCSTDLPVSEVAFRVGYTDPLYFSRLFHRRTGYAPGVFRTLGTC